MQLFSCQEISVDSTPVLSQPVSACVKADDGGSSSSMTHVARAVLERVDAVQSVNVSSACCNDSVSVHDTPCSAEPDLSFKNDNNLADLEEAVTDINDFQFLNDVNKYIPFSFLHWNIQGLLTKLPDSDFLSFICSYDFVCLVETFHECIPPNKFPGYTVFSEPAVKLSKQGRRSGGLLCLIKKEFEQYVKKIDVNYSNILLFRIDKTLFGLQKDILYVCVYVQPEGSPFYTYFDIDNGITNLEDCISDCIVTHGDMFILLSGDLNSRTSNISQNITSNDNTVSYRSEPVSGGRLSRDKNVNSYGKLLINLCTALNMCILNGMCDGDHDGCCTFISDSGSSVVDYFLM